MAYMDLTSIEQLIGIPSGRGAASNDEIYLRDRLASSLGEASVLKQNLWLWCEKQGLPSKGVRSALTHSLINAYVNRSYLRSWRNRVNPSFELLEGTSDDDDLLASPTPAPAAFADMVTVVDVVDTTVVPVAMAVGVVVSLMACPAMTFAGVAAKCSTLLLVAVVPFVVPVMASRGVAIS